MSVLGHAVALVHEGVGVGIDPDGRVEMLIPVWPFVGLWIVSIMLATREAWQQWGNVQQLDWRKGHLLYFSLRDILDALFASLWSVPLLALWRFERALWEGSVLYGPRGTQSFVEVYTGAQWVMLVQIVLIHWLLVWMVYRWMLRRGLRSGTVTVRATDRCPTCGYESSAARCPECGADRNDASAVRPRVFIPWIENRAWVRWVFRTPAALGAIVMLFFSPVWIPAIRMGVRALFP